MEKNNISEQNSVQSVKFMPNLNDNQNNISKSNESGFNNAMIISQNNQAYFAEIQKKNENSRKFGIIYFEKIWFIPLIFGALFPFCLYKNLFGIFWVLFILASLVLVNIAAKKLSGGTIEEYGKIDYVAREKSKFSIFCIITLLLISVEVCTSMSLALVTQSKILMLIFTLLYLWNIFAPKISTGLLNTIKTLFISFFYPLVRLPEPISDMSHFFKQRKLEENHNEKAGTAKAVILGLIISIPVLAIVVSLLANADLVFGKAIDGMFDWISFENADDYILIILMIIAGIWFSYCVVKGFIEENENISGTRKEKEKHNSIAAIAFSIPIAFVYIIFILIQLIFLLGHFSLPDEMTYAEYAHQGFYQLIAVAIINLFLILMIGYFFNENKALKIILMLLSFCTYGMIFSSAARLLMYINVYGMTFQRVYALFFLTIITFWLSALIVKINNPKKSVMRFCIVSATVLFLAFAFSHPDFWIAKYDIAKWESEGMSEDDYLQALEKFDDYYLNSLVHEEPSEKDGRVKSKYDYIIYQLSYDAVPAINNEKLREKVAYSYKTMDTLYLNDYSSLDNAKDPGVFQKIRNFNFSRFTALNWK